MAYTDVDCIEALRQAGERVSGKLSRDKYNETGLSPAASTIKKRFGGWNKAKKEAGLQLYDRQSPELEIPENREWSQEEWKDLSGVRRTREQQKSKLADIKVSRGCQECGYNEHPTGLTFHHTDPSEKHPSASRGMTQMHKDKVDEEIEKCVVLCWNCHMIEEKSDGRYDL